MSANNGPTSNNNDGRNNPPSSVTTSTKSTPPSGSPSSFSQPPIHFMNRTFYPTNAPTNLGGRDAHDDTEDLSFAFIATFLIIFMIGMTALTYCRFESANSTKARSTSTEQGNSTTAQDQQASSDENCATILLRAKILRVVFPEQIIESLQYDPEANDTVDDTVCPICLETFQQGHSVVAGSICKHAFHRDCILGWCQIRADCPTRRQEMWDPEEYGLVEQTIAAQESETASA